MGLHLEPLESRALFSVTLPTPVADAAAQVTNDAAVLRVDFNQAFATASAGIKEIAAQVKTEPATKPSSQALAKLETAFAVERAKDSASIVKYLGEAKLDLLRVRNTYLAELKKPTAANTLIVDKAIIALQGSAYLLQNRFLSLSGTQLTKVSNAQDALVAANPDDTALQQLANSDSTATNAGLNTVYDQINTVNADIRSLVNLIYG